MVRRAIVVLAWAGSALGCSFDSAPLGLAVCVDGQSVECACQSGAARGLQTCSDGEYGACACGVVGAPSATAASGDDGSVSSSDLASPADSLGGSAGGSSEDGSGAGAGGDSGAAGSATGAGGAAGNAGIGGNAGSAGSAGTVGAGGSNGDAGNGGRAGSSVDPVDPARPGELYGACSVQGDCQDGRICYTLSIDGSVTGYCAPACTIASGGTSLGPCEQPESGRVRAQCSPFVGLCLLGSCENADCPSGMDCVEAPSAFGQAGNSFDCRFLRP